ncbi:MAG: DUF4276 family protein [Alphaproteobacteria bacterium]|nr:DUF4276 family protein [Alphaproteobacteria bacterium]
MTRLLVHVEGQTEEEFVNEVLAPHLYNFGFTWVAARLVGGPRARKRRGGICGWPIVRTEVAKHLSDDTNAFATTIVDYYALPKSGVNGWPGRDTCEHLAVPQQAQHIVDALAADFSARHGEHLAGRFIPFIAMHEFEGLLFSHPDRMAQGMGLSALSGSFQNIRGSFATPEHINDSPITAPSKRILDLVPGYQKVLHGNLAAIEVSLPTMRSECEVFASWLSRLEALQNA